MDDVIVYYNLVIGHERTINDVPSTVRYEVIALLKEAGYDELLNSDEKGVK